MEEIEVKLKKANVAFITEAVSKLIDIIQAHALSGISGKEIAELKVLKEKCSDENSIISITALSGLVSLVKQEILDVSPTISVVISLIPFTKCYSGIASTLMELLILIAKNSIKKNGTYSNQYNLISPQFPLITLLKNNIQSWTDIFFSIETLFASHEILMQHKINILRPLLIYMFNDPTADSSALNYARYQLLSLLLLHMEDIAVKNQILEMICWLQWNLPNCVLVKLICNTISINFERHQSANNSQQTNDYIKLISAFAPVLAVTAVWMIEHGHDAFGVLKLLEVYIKISTESGGLVLCLLAEKVPFYPVIYLDSIFNICKKIVEAGACNPILAQMLTAVTLNWIVFPSSLTQSIHKAAGNLVSLINTNLKWNYANASIVNNSSFKTLYRSNIYMERTIHLINISDKWLVHNKISVDWLSRISTLDSSSSFLFMFTCGILLHTSDPVVVEECLKFCIHCISLQVNMSSIFLSVILYKLSLEVEPHLQMKYLFALTKTAVEKENVPLIISTITSLTLKKDYVANSFVIQLYLSLWTVESRTYPYLYKILVSPLPDGEAGWEMAVSKAQAMKKICSLKPALHGKELVTLLSEILNHFGSSTSGLQSSLAIDSISELCKAQIVDIAGTWKALQPKLGKDKRAEVVVSLCNLFYLIPKLRTTENECVAFISDIISRLWQYLSHSDTKCIQAALRCLSIFKIEDFTLKPLPEIYRRGIKLPDEFAKTPVDAARRPEDVLSYIPGECWVQVLEKINPDVMHDTGEMLIALMEDELLSLPRITYHLSEGKVEPLTYSYLPHRSVTRGLVDKLNKSLRTSAGNELSESEYEIVRIITQRFSKQLPPCSWTFLEVLLHNDRCKISVIKFLARQGLYSSSGKRLIEEFIFNFKPHSDNLAEVLLLFDSLPDLCKVIPPNKLRPVIESSLNLALTTALNTNETKYFIGIMNAIQSALTSNIHEANRSLLVILVESLLENIPPDHSIFASYAEVVVELPTKNIERMSSPSVWWEVTSVKLRQSIIIRSAIATRPQTTAPLVWMNECIDAAGSIPGEHSFMLQSLSVILKKNRSSNSNPKWLLELMGRIQQIMFSEEELSRRINVSLFLLDIFAVTVIFCSGDDILLDNVATIRENRLKLLPGAVYQIFKLTSWLSILPQVVEWTLHILSWKHLPTSYASVMSQLINNLRESKYCKEAKNWPRFFSLQVT